MRMRAALQWNLRTKFIAILLAVGVLPILAIGWIGYTLSEETILRQATDIRKYALERSANGLEGKLSAVQTLAGTFAREQSMREMLHPDTSPEDLRQYMKEWDIFFQMVNKYVFLTFGEWPIVTLYGYNGKVFSTWESGVGESLYSYLDRNESFRELLREARGRKPFWSGRHNDFTGQSKSDLVSFIIGYIDPASGNEWGKLIISVKTSVLFDRQTIGDERTVIYMANKPPIYPEVPLNPDLSDLATRLDQGDQIPDQGVAKFGRERVLYVASQLPNEWTMLQTVPYAELLGDLGRIRMLLLGLTALAALASIGFGHIFIGHLLRPILALVRLMKQAGHGRWEAPPEAAADPEIRVLYDAFRRMTSDLQTLQQERQQQERTRLELEFSALLSQIQPHFVKNALAAVNGLALQGKMDEIRQVIDSLGYFLSSRIYPDRPVVTLKQELTALEHYFNIMRIRYPDKFFVHMDVPESLMNQAVVRFMLQPIVENAIYHGMRADAPLYIWIGAYDADSICEITVIDDGVGTERDPLAHTQAAGGPQEPSRLGGIGLTNIDQRIRIGFGPAYGLRFESSPGAGARVEIRLPRRNKEEFE